MNKPIIDIRNECSDLKKGMEIYITKWGVQPISAMQVKVIMDDLQE